MTHVLSVGEYFTKEDPKLTALREALLSLSFPNIIIDLKESINETLNEEDEARNISHQLYLLENFDSLDDINANENFLILNKYDPIFLSETATYTLALESVYALNEGVLSTLKTAWNAMTEDGSSIGIFQFMLDIIGMIPSSWVGIPIDIASNLLNAAIYFFRDKLLLGVINLIACFDLSKVFQPLKLGLKKIASPVTGLFKWMSKAGGGKAGANALLNSTEAVANPGVIKMLGQALSKLSKWLLEKGIALLRSILPALVKGINRLTFGAFKLDKYIPNMLKAIDGWSIKLTVFAKEADEASKVLLSKKTATSAQKSITTSATDVGTAARTTAEIEAAAAGKTITQKTGQRIANDATAQVIKDLGLTKTGVQMSRYHIEVLGRASQKFTKLFPNVTDPIIKKNYIYNEATREMIEAVLSKKAGLVSILGNKKVIGTLAKGKPWKGAEQIINAAIKKGNPAELSEIMGKMLSDPELFVLISKNSPAVVKTMAMFKHAPEALINGAKAFTEFAPKLAKRGPIVYGIAKRLPIFMLKQLAKGTLCGQQIQDIKDTDELAKLGSDVKHAIVQKATSAFNPTTEPMPVIEQDLTGSDILTISKKSLDDLKAVNPQAYIEFVGVEQDVNAKIDQIKQETDSQNPCADFLGIKSSVVGATIKYSNSAYDEDYRGAVDLVGSDAFDKKGLTSQQQGYLKLINQDTGIDPQHPIGANDPVIQAYFSPIIDIHGQIQPIQTDEEREARLDKVLDKAIQDGTLDPNERETIKRMTMDHWKANTMPSQVITAVDGSPSPNESIFKIGKLITKR